MEEINVADDFVSMSAGSPKAKLLGDLLVEFKLITPEQLEKALEEQKKNWDYLGEILIKKGYITKKALGQVLEYILEIPYVDLSEVEINREVAEIFPKDILNTHRIFPIRKENKNVYIAMVSPMDLPLVDKLRLMSGYNIIPLLTTKSDLERAIERLTTAETAEQALDEIKGVGEKKEEKFVEVDKETTEDAPTIRLVDSIIKSAVDMRASDIHFESTKADMRVRFRVDGILYDKMTVPTQVQSAVLSRLKLIAGMDIAERRHPQDGRINLKYKDNQEIDMRVATFPSIFGESMVMRLLNRSQMSFSMDRLGFDPEEEKIFKDLIEKAYGMILVTGPTGSGKTTTLYTALSKINSPTTKIITIEDPVEYQLEGINQIQVNPAIEVTFARGLRTMVRLDPDVILVGEIRDADTAKTAIEAALTGHKVFSTLHTNDAPSASVRLIEMGMEPFLITSSLLGVVAQRLVRIICPNCKITFKPTTEQIKSIKTHENIEVLYKGSGCRECNYSGYKGRTGIFEIMKVNEVITRLILGREPTSAVKAIAVREGMRTMWESGLKKVFAGMTTVEELLRVTLIEEE